MTNLQVLPNTVRPSVGARTSDLVGNDAQMICPVKCYSYQEPSSTEAQCIVLLPCLQVKLMCPALKDCNITGLRAAVLLVVYVRT